MTLRSQTTHLWQTKQIITEIHPSHSHQVQVLTGNGTSKGNHFLDSSVFFFLDLFKRISWEPPQPPFYYVPVPYSKNTNFGQHLQYCDDASWTSY